MRELTNQIFESCDQEWRGIGIIPQSGVKIRNRYQYFDTKKRFALADNNVNERIDLCQSGDILRGKIKPVDCRFFGINCTPEHPLGASIVSAEGACAAY